MEPIFVTLSTTVTLCASEHEHIFSIQSADKMYYTNVQLISITVPPAEPQT